eukprot:scaffold33020_cov18-Tisochrysis_lutea.AAC.4
MRGTRGLHQLPPATKERAGMPLDDSVKVACGKRCLQLKPRVPLHPRVIRGCLQVARIVLHQALAMSKAPYDTTGGQHRMQEGTNQENVHTRMITTTGQQDDIVRAFACASGSIRLCHAFATAGGLLLHVHQAVRAGAQQSWVCLFKQWTRALDKWWEELGCNQPRVYKTCRGGTHGIWAAPYAFNSSESGPDEVILRVQAVTSSVNALTFYCDTKLCACAALAKSITCWLYLLGHGRQSHAFPLVAWAALGCAGRHQSFACWLYLLGHDRKSHSFPLVSWPALGCARNGHQSFTCWLQFVGHDRLSHSFPFISWAASR